MAPPPQDLVIEQRIQHTVQLLTQLHYPVLEGKSK